MKIDGYNLWYYSCAAFMGMAIVAPYQLVLFYTGLATNWYSGVSGMGSYYNSYFGWSYLVLLAYIILSITLDKIKFGVQFYISLISNGIAAICLIVFGSGCLYIVNNPSTYFEITETAMRAARGIVIISYIQLFSTLQFLYQFNSKTVVASYIGGSLLMFVFYFICYCLSMNGDTDGLYSHAKAASIVVGVISVVSVPATIWYVYNANGRRYLSYKPELEDTYNPTETIPYKEKVRNTSMMSLILTTAAYAVLYPYLGYGLGNRATTLNGLLTYPLGMMWGINLGSVVGFSIFAIPYPKLLFSFLLTIVCFAVWIVSWWVKSNTATQALNIIGSFLVSGVNSWCYASIIAPTRWGSYGFDALIVLIMTQIVFNWIGSVVW